VNNTIDNIGNRGIPTATKIRKNAKKFIAFLVFSIYELLDGLVCKLKNFSMCNEVSFELSYQSMQDQIWAVLLMQLNNRKIKLLMKFSCLSPY
jgi:hypothetical protein